MKNIYRFLIGLAITLVVIILLAVLLTVLAPLIIAGVILFYVIIVSVVLLLVIAGFFVFVWYISRKEPEGKNTKASSNYSIDQGKEV